MGRELGIDLLRGLAILGVVVFHLWAFTKARFAFPPRHSTLLDDVAGHVQDTALLSALTSAFEVAFRSGRDGVSLFIILSGTALTISAMRGGSTALLPFYRRRFDRILRSYWAGFLVVMVSLFLLAMPKTLIDGGSFRYNWTHVGLISYFDTDQFFAGLLLLPRLWKLDWVFAPPNPLWFIVLIIQYYLLFPGLQRTAGRVGFPALVGGSLALSLACTAGLLLWFDGRLGSQGWIIAIWSPFRIFEFALGMALGYVLVRHRKPARRLVDGLVPTLGCVTAGITLYLLGAMIDDDDGYLRVVAFPLIAAGLATLSLPVLLKMPGHLEGSIPGRTLAWIGPMSLAVLIMNEPFRFVDNYLWLKDVSWTPGWWIYIVGIYVPGTLVGGALLSRALGLTPRGHLTELLALVTRKPPLLAADSVPTPSGPSGERRQ